MHSRPIWLVCPVYFKGHLERRVMKVSKPYRGHSITYAQSGDWCDQCNDGILTGKDAMTNQAKLLERRAPIDNKGE